LRVVKRSAISSWTLYRQQYISSLFGQQAVDGIVLP